MTVIEREVAAVQGAKCSVAVNGVICIWYGGSVVNAYRTTDWVQIGHWNIEFEEGLTYDGKLAVAKENINTHIENEYFPS